MSTKHTPWFPNMQVIQIRRFEHELLKNEPQYKARMNSITGASLNFAAKCGNEIIEKLLRGNKNA